ncbi:MAG: hypothetical protein PSX37_02960, partial [bacterium]|nr:hypothetical protein [bacterium]
MDLPRESTLSPRGHAWVSRTHTALDMLAIAFLIAFVLLWAFPEASAGVRTALDAVSWVVWGAFVVDYFVRLACSIPKVVFIRTHKLDLLMVLVPMLRLLRVFLVLRKALSSVSTEKIASSIVSLVVVIVLALIRGVQTFDEVFVLTGGGPGTATLMVVQYIYET